MTWDFINVLRMLGCGWLPLALCVLGGVIIPGLHAQEVAAERIIVAGALTDNYPHSFVENDQPLAGYAVDMLAAVEHTMGLKIRRVVGDTTQINAAFGEGKLDMLQSLAQSVEREQAMDFSVPYITMTGYIFVHKNSTGIQSLEDLRGSKVLVHPGSLGERLLISAGLSNCIVHVISVEEAFLKLSQGKGDATLAANITGEMMVSRLRIGNVVTVGGPIPGFQVRYCFAVKEGDKELLAKINEGLAIIQRTGEAERIYRKWFSQIDPRGYSALQITLAVAGGLTVALVVAIWGVFRQRSLRNRITLQAEKLRASEEEYRGIFELSLFGVIVASQQGDHFVLERINPAAMRLFGIQSDPIRGLPIRQLFQNENDLWDKLKLNDKAGEFEYYRANRPGATWLRVTTSYVGSLVQIVLADVTTAKLVEEKLRQSQKLEAIGTLSSGIAHDFNNILTSIMGNSELIRMETTVEGLVAESNDEILNAAERARKLVRQILSFSRRSDTKLEVIELTPIIKETIRFLRSVTPSNIEIRHKTTAQPTLVKADATQIHQVLMNLGTNAVHAMRGQVGRLEFSEERLMISSELMVQHPQLREGEYLHISVRDSGCGMPPEVLQRVFEPFFTTKAPGEGTGLGLSVVHGIILSHQGAVTVQSQPGNGSEFHLYFPLAFEGTAPSGKFEKNLPQAGHGARIMFVDDEESIRRVAEQVLGRFGYKVASFSDPRIALAQLQIRQNEFDIVVTDLTMPFMDGLELIAQARALRPNIPVALASGFLSESECKQAQALQVNRILEKPLNFNKVAEAVGDCINRS